MDHDDSDLRLIGEAFLSAGNPARAVDQFRAALARHPDDGEAALGLARALLADGDANAALIAVEEALRLTPADSAALAARALILLALDRPVLAEASARQALDHDPANPMGHLALALPLARLHRRQAAVTAFETALRLDPGYVPALVQYGFFCADQRRLNAAAELAERATALAADDPDVLTLRAWVALRRGHVSEADQLARWAVRQVATPEAVRLLMLVKSRRNPIFGLWWSATAWTTGRTKTEINRIWQPFSIAWSLLAIGLGVAVAWWLGVALYLSQFAFAAYLGWSASRIDKVIAKAIEDVQLSPDF